MSSADPSFVGSHEQSRDFRILLSPLFLSALGLLAVNDWLLKAAYPGWITGKLSDLTGLFAFTAFAMMFALRWRTVVAITIAAVFVFWKSSASSQAIAAFNALSPVKIGRVVDADDLLALAVIPIAWWLVARPAQRSERDGSRARDYNPRVSRPYGQGWRLWATGALLVASPLIFAASAARRNYAVEMHFCITHPKPNVNAIFHKITGSRIHSDGTFKYVDDEGTHDEALEGSMHNTPDGVLIVTITHIYYHIESPESLLEQFRTLALVPLGDSCHLVDSRVIMPPSPDPVTLAQETANSAASGNADAMTELGRFYEKGYGAPQSYVTAAVWYAKADMAGSLDGTNQLARLYQTGLGVPRDTARARALYLKGAEDPAWGEQARKGLRSLDAEKAPPATAAIINTSVADPTATTALSPSWHPIVTTTADAPSSIPAPWSSAAGRDTYGTWADLTVNSIIQRFRLIPGGTFQMGSPVGAWQRQPDETEHTVTLTRAFWLADSACTQAFWRAIAPTNPSYALGDPRRPVVSVSWDDCADFIAHLNRGIPGLNAGFPTEAQREYACRAGTITPFPGDDLNAIAWYHDNSRDKTHPVKQKNPNPWGLYDMIGNTMEWCSDFTGVYPDSAVTDPIGPRTGWGRRIRGASWSMDSYLCRSAFRSGLDAKSGGLGISLRLCILVAADYQLPAPAPPASQGPSHARSPSPAPVRPADF